MKGREAVRAAQRRTNEAAAEVEQARAELASERADRRREQQDLRGEIKRLKADHIAEAGRIAAEEVARRLAQLEEERRAKGLSVDVAQNAFILKDKFVRNACRYISMTTGEMPVHALSQVMTWMTDEDFYGFTGADLLVKLGLPPDGWVAKILTFYKHDLKRMARQRIRDNNVAAVSLDHAYEQGNPRIHPSYSPKWYPPINYRGMELMDDVPTGT